MLSGSVDVPSDIHCLRGHGSRDVELTVVMAGSFRVSGHPCLKILRISRPGGTALEGSGQETTIVAVTNMPVMKMVRICRPVQLLVITNCPCLVEVNVSEGVVAEIRISGCPRGILFRCGDQELRIEEAVWTGTIGVSKVSVQTEA
jgi:hypothetical protein